MKSTSCLLLAAALSAVTFASGQVTLHDFTAFESPNTVFVGDWALNGDPISGDSSPIASFSQGAGFYNFIGGTTAETSGVYYFLPVTPSSLPAFPLLEISARLLQGNTAPTFAVSLFNFGTGESAVAIFNTASFSSAGFTNVRGTLLSSFSFDPTGVDAFLIGGVTGGSGTLNLAINNLAVVSAVPEPSTYGLVAALALVGIVAIKRRR
jgi:hypothetical protein